MKLTANDTIFLVGDDGVTEMTMQRLVLAGRGGLDMEKDNLALYTDKAEADADFRLRQLRQAVTQKLADMDEAGLEEALAGVEQVRQLRASALSVAATTD